MLHKETSKFLPVYLYVDGQNALVVGGGKVAARKISILQNYNLTIYVVSPQFSSEVIELNNLRPNSIQLINEEFNHKHLDIKPFVVVFATTDNHQLNVSIAKLAKEKGVIANLATSLEDNHFIMPAIIKKNDYQIAISTSGTSPLLAKIIKEELSNEFTPKLSAYSRILREIRKFMKEHHNDDFALRKKVYNKVLNSPDILNKLDSGSKSLEETLNLLIRELN